MRKVSEPSWTVAADPETAIPEAVEGCCWWVAHTRARNEKALARNLEQLAVTYYLPLRRRMTRSPRTGRPSIALLPLFTGYLFFIGTEQQRYRVMATNRVAGILPEHDQRRLITQLRSVHRVLASDLEFERVGKLAAGRWVRAVAGPLVGVEGRVVRRLGRTRLAISVDILGQSVLVDVDAELLEPIDAPEPGGPSSAWAGSSAAGGWTKELDH